MLTYNKLMSYGIHANDGDIGRIKDIYFDDVGWCCRYLVVDTNRWLPGRKILLSPEDLAASDTLNGYLPVALSKAEVESSPSIDDHIPVSRQHELQLSHYYGWDQYWVPPTPASDPFPVAPVSPGILNYEMSVGSRAPQSERPLTGDSHLRSCKELTKYRVLTADEQELYLIDFLFDPETWRLTNFIINIGGWLTSRSVILPPLFVEEIDNIKRTVEISLAATVLDQTPTFDQELFSEDYERRVVKHYFDNMGDAAATQRRKHQAPHEEATSYY